MKINIGVKGLEKIKEMNFIKGFNVKSKVVRDKITGEYKIVHYVDTAESNNNIVRINIECEYHQLEYCLDILNRAIKDIEVMNNHIDVICKDNKPYLCAFTIQEKFYTEDVIEDCMETM